MIRCFELKPVRNGMPVRAKLPVIREEEVTGRVLNSPPIFGMSCSSFKLRMVEPEHVKSIALKKAWAQTWKKATYT